MAENKTTTDPPTDPPTKSGKKSGSYKKTPPSEKKTIETDPFAPKNLEYPISMKGLKEWYYNVFEKLGWMVLAHRDQRETKIASYKEGLIRLQEAFSEKLKYIKDEDEKKDIEIYLYNLSTLIHHVHDDFSSLPTNVQPRNKNKEGGSSKSLKKNKKNKNKKNKKMSNKRK